MTPDDLNSFLNYLFTGLAYSVAIPFFYIVIFKSPSAIRIYRNTILNMASWYIITIGFYSILLQPIYATLPSESCVKFAGLTSYFGREVHVAAVFLAAQRLTTNLVVLLFLPIIFDVIPICILCYMVYIKSDSLYFWVSFTSHTPFWDVMLSFLATLYFVTPYRKAVKKMLWKTNVITSSNNS
ncbi:hypothetical protein QR680_015309 [Steinernema hermaphroditum]|uniref:Uncharacterized protein n=1 Tax=Steinernema hermaphroditum TaxID=289476 RepID=A0AA39LKH4_9BILA|nr:hypothetical protein QR680_015309 [Steinernema hermaphroditum]